MVRILVENFLKRLEEDEIMDEFGCDLRTEAKVRREDKDDD